MPYLKTDGVIDFSTNDYLLLSRNETVIKDAMQAAQQYGVGATGSRLLSGNNELCEALESHIALDKGEQAGLVFNSGFQANMSVLSCLLDRSVLKKRPIVFFDKLNHASLYQAVFLSGAELVRYHHNDMTHLETLLKKYTDDRPRFIVAETVFGMDGDLLPIDVIANLAEKYHAFLYLDEAHATGIFGPYGLSTTVDLTQIEHLVMGTLSKAIGVSGGYVALSAALKNYVINKASGFMYSTAPSPMVIGAALAAWKLVKNLNAERIKLLDLATQTRMRLRDLGYDIGTSASHIIPIIVGSSDEALRLKERLFQRGILVSALRPPTVPPNGARIRIALNIGHTQDHVNQLLDAVCCIFAKLTKKFANSPFS